MNAKTEEARLLVAVGELVDRGLLEPESDPELADVRVEGRGFRYLAKLWEWVGVLEPLGPPWRLRVRDFEDIKRARLRVAAEWVIAGAPVTWARAEADAALALFLERYSSWGGAAHA